MAITKIKAKNFKSFRDLDIKLGKFNVIVGANASGKSNFVHLFEFLRDIEGYDLENAISMQGEIEFLRNLTLGSSPDLYIEISSDSHIGFAMTIKSETIGIKSYETIYKFSLGHSTLKPGIRVKTDQLNSKCEFIKLKRDLRTGKFEEESIISKGELLVKNDQGKIEIDFKNLKKIGLSNESLFPPYFLEQEFKQKLLLETLFFHMPLHFAEIFQEIAIYNIDPKMCRRATPIKGKTDLEEDGCNLAFVLKNIIENKEKKRKFNNIIKDILTFIEDLGIDRFADKSLLVKFREKYSQTKYLPASLVSDGTINITALIVALYFETKELIIIEEPGKNIHPYLISKVISMMKDVSNEKQILITTHNPEFLKNVDINDIILVSRDRYGFSKMCRPFEKEEVKLFLKNDNI